VILLHTINVSDKKIKTLIKEYDLKQIQEVCQVYKEAKKSAIKNIDSWLTIALKENWISKATERQRLSIISLEDDKKEVEAKAEEWIETYRKSPYKEWFDALLSIQQDFGQGRYKALSEEEKSEFRERIQGMCGKYDDFESIPFTEEIIKFLKER